jgi:hypothetical protein
MEVTDVVRYLRQFCAQQSVEAMLPGIPRWLKRLHEYGVDTVPLAIGSTGAAYAELFTLQDPREPSARRMARDVRDTLPNLRPYKES